MITRDSIAAILLNLILVIWLCAPPSECHKDDVNYIQHINDFELKHQADRQCDNSYSEIVQVQSQQECKEKCLSKPNCCSIKHPFDKSTSCALVLYDFKRLYDSDVNRNCRLYELKPSLRYCLGPKTGVTPIGVLHLAPFLKVPEVQMKKNIGTLKINETSGAVNFARVILEPGNVHNSMCIIPPEAANKTEGKCHRCQTALRPSVCPEVTDQCSDECDTCYACTDFDNARYGTPKPISGNKKREYNRMTVGGKYQVSCASGFYWEHTHDDSSVTVTCKVGNEGGWTVKGKRTECKAGCPNPPVANSAVLGMTDASYSYVSAVPRDQMAAVQCKPGFKWSRGDLDDTIIMMCSEAGYWKEVGREEDEAQVLEMDHDLTCIPNPDAGEVPSKCPGHTQNAVITVLSVVLGALIIVLVSVVTWIVLQSYMAKQEDSNKSDKPKEKKRDRKFQRWRKKKNGRRDRKSPGRHEHRRESKERKPQEKQHMKQPDHDDDSYYGYGLDSATQGPSND